MKLNEEVNLYKCLNERLEKEKQEVTIEKLAHSSQVTSQVTPQYASEEFPKTLSRLNSEVEVEKVKTTISTQEEQNSILHDKIKERESKLNHGRIWTKLTIT